MSLDNVKSFCVTGETDEIDGVLKVVQKANVTKLTMFLIELNVLLIRPCFLLDCYVLCIGNVSLGRQYAFKRYLLLWT